MRHPTGVKPPTSLTASRRPGLIGRGVFGLRQRRSGIVRVCASFAAAVLAGCGGPSHVDDAVACFPPDARPFLHREGAGRGGAEEPAATRATIYVDRSGSMGGYLVGATGDERPLQDLIRVLPDALQQGGTSVGYVAFGTRLLPQPAAERDALMRPDFYSCRSRTDADCDNQESRFDLVLRDVEAKPDEMALMISDLWFVNSQVRTSALTDLAAPFAGILSKGRAVAVYGIPARFRGPIYDLPSAPGRVDFAGRHPLFLVAIGTDDQLDRLHARIAEGGSPYLAGAVGDGTIRRTLFTLTPSRPGPRDAEPLVGGHPAVVRAPVIGSLPGVRIQQLTIDKGAALRSRGVDAGPVWRGPEPAAVQKDAAWAGTLQGRTRVWERRGERCLPTDWIEGRGIEGLWSPAGDAALRFRLDPRVVAAGVGRPGTYLLVGQVDRTALAIPNPASRWMRDWSFSASQSPSGRSEAGVPFFPTLHLAEVARLMEGALAEAARRRPRPVAGFDAVVRVVD